MASLSGSKQPTANPISKQDAQKAALAFARCRRQHGIDMPDPNPNGGATQLPKRINPDDPKFKAAQQACQKDLPNNGKGGTLTDSGV